MKTKPGSNTARVTQPRPAPRVELGVGAEIDWELLARQTGFRVKALASRLGCSTRQLERRLRQSLGASPKRRLEELRLAPSLPLLANGVPVKVAAAELGFASAADFSRAFTRFYGIAPRSVASGSVNLLPGASPTGKLRQARVATPLSAPPPTAEAGIECADDPRSPGNGCRILPCDFLRQPPALDR